MSDIGVTIQTLIDNAVKEGRAPGLQCVLFKGDQIIFNGVSGYALLPSKDDPAGKLMTPFTLQLVGSCTKLVVSLIALHVLERELIEGVSLADLDNPDALVKFVPEFAPGSGSLTTKILEGFDDHLTPDGKKAMKLKDAKNRVNFRHLFTHSSGFGTPANNPLLWELLVPSGNTVPHIGPVFNGVIHDITIPLLFEPGTEYHYGLGTAWLAQFIVRGTGKHLRQLMKEIICDPLQIPMSEMDFWVSPEFSVSKAGIYSYDQDSPGKFQLSPFDIYAAEHGPAEGKTYYAEAGLYASSQAFCKVLQAVVTRDPRILSQAATWELAIEDDFSSRGLKVTRPDLKSTFHAVVADIIEFGRTNSDNGTGINFLSGKVALAETITGRPSGSFGWGGLPNSYFSMDPASGLGVMLSGSVFPFYHPKMAELWEDIERVVYQKTSTD